MGVCNLDFPAHAGQYILVGVDLAAQAVVLAQMMVVLASIAMQHQYIAAIGRKHVA